MTAVSTLQHSRRVLVLGANGRFGLAVARAFDAGGWEVLAQVRRDPAPGMPAHARIMALPLHDIDRIAAESVGAEVVIYAVNPRDYTRWATDLLPMARQGMDIAERLGARFAVPGNVYNYGAAMPTMLSAGTPQWPSTRKGRLRVQFEAELRQRASQLRSTILRAGDFFGAGTGNWFDQVVVKSIAKGRLAYPGTPTLVHAWAYLPDMARAMVHLCELEGLPPFIDIPYPGITITGAGLLDALESVARSEGLGNGRPFRRDGAPWALLRALAPVVPLWREILEMRYLWETPHGMDATVLARWLPSFQATPLPDALRASLYDLNLTPARARVNDAGVGQQA